MTQRTLPLLILGGLLAASSWAAPGDPTGKPAALQIEDDGDSLREALAGGRSWVKLRYRFENVDQDGFARDANASTLRTLLGYETATWNGLSVLLEAEDVSPVGNALYDSGVNGVNDRPKVIDPDGTEVNQTYLKYTGWADTAIRVGRQRIILDNHRFVGNVGWRQNEQTFDAWSIEGQIPGDVEVFAAWVTNVNRVFGEDSAGGDHHMGSFLVNLQREFEDLGTLNVYAFDLDYDTATTLSTTTFGASFAGKVDLESVDIPWRLEFADQSDSGDNPNSIDASYTNVEIGAALESCFFKVGGEILEGSGTTGDRFSTPLATLHAFNGWADKFLTTPDTGLQDLYFSVGGTAAQTKLAAVYHDFQSDAGSVDYGTELDLVASRKFESGLTAGLKYADYSTDGFSVDTTKAWIWLAYSF